MSIKIHHGPPGSYKTSGAMGDDFLREAKAGRLIVTNVRGVSRERCLDAFDDLPDTFDVIWIDDKTEEGRQKLHTWFHWVPKGAYLFVDEAQDIWPRSWRDADLRALDYPGGLEKAGLDDRPYEWAQAWDKHRHWNWDVVLTTPNIKKIREDIRGAADGAYKHKDLALLGFRGRYIEGFHSAEDTGTSESQFYSIERKKVPSYVWKIYDSTATGKFSATKSGKSIFKDPKILFLLFILLCSLGFSFRNGFSLNLMPPVLSGKPAGAKADNPTSSASPVPASNIPRNDLGARQTGNSGGGVGAASDDIPFADGNPVIVGTFKIGAKTRYLIDLGDAYLTSDDYMLAGFRVDGLGPCAVRMEYQGRSQIIRCGRQNLPVASSSAVRSPPSTVEIAPFNDTAPTSAAVPPSDLKREPRA